MISSPGFPPNLAADVKLAFFTEFHQSIHIVMRAENRLPLIPEVFPSLMLFSGQNGLKIRTIFCPFAPFQDRYPYQWPESEPAETIFSPPGSLHPGQYAGSSFCTGYPASTVQNEPWPSRFLSRWNLRNGWTFSGVFSV